MLTQYGEALCINCGWDGRKVIADERHPSRLGHAPTYEGTVRLWNYFTQLSRQQSRRYQEKRRNTKRRREAAG